MIITHPTETTSEGRQGQNAGNPESKALFLTY